jgi:hypothetical protein
LPILTLRDHRKAPLKYRWLLRVLYTLALLPAVYVAYSRNLQLDMGSNVSKLTREFWQDAHWALSPPTDFWPPILAIIGDAVGFAALPSAFIPISSLILAGCILGSIASSLDRKGNFSFTMVAVALCLGATPLFFGPMAVGDPIFWGPGIWFFAARSLARIESRDMFQHELALGLSLAVLMLLDPAAPIMILGVFIFLPLILPRTSKRNYLEALVLTISPGLMVVFLQISSYATLHSLPLLEAIRIWSNKLQWSSDFFRFAWNHHINNGTNGPLPHFLRVTLHVTPLLPLAFFLPTIRERKYHPATLSAVLVLPLINGLIYSAHAGVASHRVWLLYLTLGMLAWLAETPLSGRWGKYFTFIICLWPLAVGWVAILAK